MPTHAIANHLVSILGAVANHRPQRNASQKRHLVWLGIFAGLVLTVIGIRFIAVPQSAAFTFGLGQQIVGDELHHVVAMRDLWLGLMAVALAALREWRALGLWFVMGAAVCVADAGIVASTTATWWALAFHLSSGLFCGWVGIACLRYAKRQVAA
jgi:Domain of unknown function (DUF4267)